MNVESISQKGGRTSRIYASIMGPAKVSPLFDCSRVHLGLEPRAGRGILLQFVVNCGVGNCFENLGNRWVGTLLFV